MEFVILNIFYMMKIEFMVIKKMINYYYHLLIKLFLLQKSMDGMKKTLLK